MMIVSTSERMEISYRCLNNIWFNFTCSYCYNCSWSSYFYWRISRILWCISNSYWSYSLVLMNELKLIFHHFVVNRFYIQTRRKKVTRKTVRIRSTIGIQSKSRESREYEIHLVAYTRWLFHIRAFFFIYCC